jgi:FkbM family methyltransferase
MLNRLKNQLSQLVKQQCMSVSQAGQDFWVYAESFNEMAGGFFVDVGANDGITLSNTFLLEKRYNWSGILVEANPMLYRELLIHRNAKSINLCVDDREGNVDFLMDGLFGSMVPNVADPQQSGGKVVSIRSSTLGDILRDNGAPRIIDYLSIDIEGAEDKALLGFPFSEFCFRCITIERPSEALQDLLKENRYQCVKIVPSLDYFYIHSDFESDYARNLGLFWKKRLIKVCVK